MRIQIDELRSEELKKKNLDSLRFGQDFTDRMFIMEYDKGKGWHDARITKYHDLQLSPATMSFHYAQTIFEGLKAYLRPDGKAALFRPMENMKRMNRSAERMCMPSIDEEFTLSALKQLILLEKDWIPRGEGQSLYIRPTMMGVDPVIGVHASHKYLFFIILSPVGAYFASGFSTSRIWVEDSYVRTVKGGTGEAKTGGNYAASLKATEEAMAKGYDQVLWLDGCERKYIEEVGSMNIFFVIDGKLVTPELQGSVLPGVTRKSVITLAKDMGLVVEERPITIDEVISGIQSGEVEEAFGSGTAAVVSPVGTLGYKGKDYVVGGNAIGPITKSLYDELTGIQYGRVEDRYGWVEIVG